MAASKTALLSLFTVEHIIMHDHLFFGNDRTLNNKYEVNGYLTCNSTVNVNSNTEIISII